MLDVTVAVPTYLRNDHLVELIPMVVGQAQEVAASGQYNVRILVIDNDPCGGAAETVRTACGATPDVVVEYVHEQLPGLAAVRNRAITESEGSRLLAFIDDDGRPGAHWLAALLEVWAATGSAAVAGRVLEHYERTPDPWIIAGGFFRRRSLPTFTSVRSAPCGNLLIDLDVVRRMHLRFDEGLGLTGGEDTLFTRRLTSAGESIVWSDESHVIDQVPAARATREWVLQRARSHGNTTGVVALALAKPGWPRALARASCATGGVVRVAAGVLRLAVGELTGSLVHQARGLRLAHRGLGMLTAAGGRVVEEYRR
jgi:GT2 family glycosyltransferase